MDLQTWLTNKGYDPTTTTILVPDFEYAWYRFNLLHKITTHTVPFTTMTYHEEFKQSICLALLVPEEYDWNNDPIYTYDQCQLADPSFVYKTMIFMSAIVLLPSSSDTAVNLWDITKEDEQMIQLFTQYYRKQDITLPEFSSLTSILAKLIHMYLDYLLTGNTSNVPKTKLVTSNSLLQLAFETKLRQTILDGTLSKYEQN